MGLGGRLDLEKVWLLLLMLRFFLCFVVFFLQALTIPDLHACACGILQG